MYIYIYIYIYIYKYREMSSPEEKAKAEQKAKDDEARDEQNAKISKAKDLSAYAAYYGKGGYGSIANTFKEAKEKDPTITLDYVRGWFSSNVLGRKHPKGTNSFVAPHPGYEYQVDLYFLADLEKQKFPLAVLCIDIFSKYAVVVPVSSWDKHPKHKERNHRCHKTNEGTDRHRQATDHVHRRRASNHIKAHAGILGEEGDQELRNEKPRTVRRTLHPNL
jgi:hypothetical protein